MSIERAEVMAIPDIMFDIEALDTAETAVVLSVGWCYFDWNNPSANVVEGGHFCLDRPAQLAEGRTVSADTAKWWVQQETPAILAAFAGADDGTEAKLEEFMLALDSSERIWAHGIDYDCRIMSHFFAQQVPLFKWPYWKQCDARTFKTLLIDYVPDHPYRPKGVAHHALDDAVNQAQLMRKIALGLKARDVRFQGLEG